MSPPIILASVEVEPYTLRFPTPLRTSAGLFAFRQGFVVRLTTSTGSTGLGDAASWPGFGSGHEQLAGALATLCSAGLHNSAVPASLERLAAWVADRAALPEVAYALELALLDLLGKRKGKPIAELLWPGAWRARVQTHWLLNEQADTADTVDQASTLKLKVGARGLAQDVARMRALRERHGPTLNMRLDAGGAWTLDEALAAVEAFAPLSPEWIEQPVAKSALRDMAQVRARANRAGIRIAADESVATGADLDAVLVAQAADIVVLKPMYCGGLLPAQALAGRARRAGLDVVITHALESAVGRAGAVHLAAGIPGVHGLGDPQAEPIASIAVHAGPGSGASWARPEPDRPPLSIPHPLEGAALARPDHPALIMGGTNLSARQLAQLVKQRAADLWNRGARPGTTVALVGPRSVDWVLWFHAVGWIGAVAVPIGPDDSNGATCTPADMTIQTDAPWAAHSASAPPERFWPLHEPRVVLRTSGTTGAPREVALTTAELLMSAFGSMTRLGHDPGDRWLCCLPLHHVAGVSILMRCAFYGTSVILHERFDAARVAEGLDSGEVTMVSLVPSTLERVLDARGVDPFPSSLRVILLGGDPPSAALLERCRALEAPVALTWGMTETASQIATRWPGDLTPPDQGAPPLPFVRVSAEGPRLAVTGPVVTGGAQVTSDLGHVNARGHVVVLGRADDAILSGGETIVPARIERILLEHPSVAAASIVAVPSARWGQRPVAALVADGAPVSSDSLRAWCKDRMAGHEIPDRFVWRDALPTTPLGKIARKQLQQHLVAEGDRPEASPVAAETAGTQSSLDTNPRMHEGQHE